MFTILCGLALLIIVLLAIGIKRSRGAFWANITGRCPASLDDSTGFHLDVKTGRIVTTRGLRDDEVEDILY